MGVEHPSSSATSDQTPSGFGLPKETGLARIGLNSAPARAKWLGSTASQASNQVSTPNVTQTQGSTASTGSVSGTTTTVTGGTGKVSGATASASASGTGQTLAATGAPIVGGLLGGILFLLGALGLRNRRR